MVQQLKKFEDLGMLLLRITVGVIFIVHSMPKFTNPSGLAMGLGIAGAAWLIYILAAVELVGGLALIAGVFSDIAAIALAADMIGAIYFKTVAWNIGFMGLKGTGWEFDLVLLAACLAIATSGANRFMLQKKSKAEPTL